MKTSSFPLKTLFKNWQLWLVAIALFLLFQWTSAPVAIRALVMVPLEMSVIMLAYLLIRSVFCNNTTDKTADDVQETKTGWALLSEGERVKLVIIERCCFFIGGCILYAGHLIIFGGFGGAGAAIEAIK